MSPTAQTRINLIAALNHLGVNTSQAIFSEDDLDNQDRSRCTILDVNSRILSHCAAHSSVWSRDSGKNHGPGIRGSYRSKTTPSVQICIQEARGGDFDYVLRCDIDYHSPFSGNAGEFVKHTGEVLHNRLHGDTTNPFLVRAMLKTHMGLDVPLAELQPVILAADETAASPASEPAA